MDTLLMGMQIALAILTAIAAALGLTLRIRKLIRKHRELR